MPALDERKAAILQAIVQGYVREGEPVSSKRIVEEYDLGVSAATVRADMAALEEAGLVRHPHTSAGRIPTDRGYRYFVDSLPQTAPLRAEQRQALEELLLEAGDIEQLLRRATGVLSRVTRFAALVVAPRIDHSRLRHLELVTLGPTSLLAVVIADTGRVSKHLLELDEPVAEHDVGRARHAINDAAAGLRFSQAADVLGGLAEGAPPQLRALVSATAAFLREGPATPASEQVFVGGTANIAGAGYFEGLDQVRQVYETFEEQVVLLTLLQETLAEGDPAVRIGSELPLVELAACSVVAAGYGSPASAAGSVGVLGPTRMDYPRTLSAVQAVASSLEKALAELTGGRDEPDRNP